MKTIVLDTKPTEIFLCHFLYFSVKFVKFDNDMDGVIGRFEKLLQLTALRK